MKILAKAGNDNIATVYIADFNGKKIEFVESIQPPISIEKKWVLIISSLFGCPVGCKFCDAGGYYEGKLSKNQLLNQIDFLVKSKFPDKIIQSEKFKIQFARMGEPAFNENVISVIEEIPQLYNIKEFIPSISTVAPFGTDTFFEQLLLLKKNKYKKTFQLQFSIHSTDEEYRDWLIPIKKWSFDKISSYGEKFFDIGGKKITLNFALCDSSKIETAKLLEHFSPEIFIIKITPVNPTIKANENNIDSYIKPSVNSYKIIEELKMVGYEVILSIGEWEENNIGSNCGQYISSYLKEAKSQINGYTYELQAL